MGLDSSQPPRASVPTPIEPEAVSSDQEPSPKVVLEDLSLSEDESEKEEEEDASHKARNVLPLEILWATTVRV